MITLLVSLVMASSPSLAESGVSVRGGGHTMTIGQNEVLLDFIEHASEPEWFGSKRYPIVLNQTVAGVDLGLLQAKMRDIASIDPLLAASALTVMHDLSWGFSRVPLTSVDPDSSVRGPYHQAALRTGSQVLIDAALWSKMDAKNRVALVIHEAIAALANEPVTDPAAARALVAALFDRSFAARPRAQQTALLAHFPSLEVFSLRAQRMYNPEDIRVRFNGEMIEFAPTVAGLDLSNPVAICSQHVYVRADFFEVVAKPDILTAGGSFVPYYTVNYVESRKALIDLTHGCSTLAKTQLRELSAWFKSFKSLSQN